MVVAEGQTSLAPSQALEFANYDVELDRIKGDLLGPDPDKTFVESIKTYGLLQPVVLRQDRDGFDMRVIAGRRRVKAHRILGLPKIAARVPLNDDGWTDDAVLAFVENAQRSDNDVVNLDIIEQLVARGLNAKEIAKHFGVKPRLIERYMGMADLHASLREAMMAGKIAFGVAEHCAKLPAEVQRKLVQTYETTGKVTGADVRRARQEEIAERPDTASLFGEEKGESDRLERGENLVDELETLFPEASTVLYELRGIIRGEVTERSEETTVDPDDIAFE